ncbi:hypothetical protein ACWIUD_04725 [Helicobacter sp. 23-1044]
MNYFIQKNYDKLKNFYHKKALYYLYFIGLIIAFIALNIDDGWQKDTLLSLGFLVILIPSIADFI